MGTSVSEIAIPFVGALQASISVLLTIFYGVLAAQFKLLSGNAAKEVSNTCVKLFLPALLIYKIGSELQSGTALRYVPILCELAHFPCQSASCTNI
jgi:predicted permease